MNHVRSPVGLRSDAATEEPGERDVASALLRENDMMNFRF